MTHFQRRAAFTLTAGALLLSLAACSREDAPANDGTMANDAMAANDMADGNAIGAMQSFNFVGGDGGPLGSVSVSDGAGGLALSVAATGMPAGTHGIHLH